MSADLIDSLPPEITLEILSFLDTKSLCNVSQTCKRWHDIIYNTDLLWIRKCKSLDRKDVQEDIPNGEWRNIFISNYGTNKIKKLWLEGKFSKVKSADELPCNFLGPFNVETWGSILDAEISRSGWTNWTETFNSMKQSSEASISDSLRVSSRREISGWTAKQTPWPFIVKSWVSKLQAEISQSGWTTNETVICSNSPRVLPDCKIVTRIAVQLYFLSCT